MTNKSNLEVIPSIAKLTTRSRRKSGIFLRNESLILGGGTMTILLLVWEACWQVGWISPLFFSGPSAIIDKFIVLSANGQLWRDAAYSGQNYFIGFF